MKRHADKSGEPQLVAMSPIATSSLRDESADHPPVPIAAPPPATATAAAVSPAGVELEEAPGGEKRRRSNMSGGRALRFAMPEGASPAPTPRSWLEQLSYTDEEATSVSRYPDPSRYDDIDQLLQGGPRFADLIRPGREEQQLERQPEVAEEHYRGAGSSSGLREAPGEAPAVAIDPSVVLASPTVGGKFVNRFDEAEIDNRRRTHYRAHQPLKSLEPKVLRKLKERIEKGRTQAVMARDAGVQKPLPPEGQTEDDKETRPKRSGRRRRRRRRRHRSKKSEPFQPTLGHVSEEQQSLSPEDDDDDGEEEEEEEEDDVSSFDPDGGHDTLDEMEEDLEDDDQQKPRDSPENAALQPSKGPDAEAAAKNVDGGSAGQTGGGGEVALEGMTFTAPSEGASPKTAKAASNRPRRPSFHLGWDSTRNSEANLQNLKGSSGGEVHRSNTTASADACSATTCCPEDPATCPEPPCAEETCPDNQGSSQPSGQGRSSRHRHHHHHHHHHHGHREHFSKKDLRERCFSGAELRQLFLSQRSNSQAPTEAEEALGLKAKDLEDMESHRMDRVKHHRHKPSMHRAPNSIVSVVEIDPVMAGMTDEKGHLPSGVTLAGSPSTGAFRSSRSVDHRPHDLFVELDELTFYQQDRMWQWNEKARWIRFEEDLVEGGERWGKAHVASLSFHSLLQMRNLLESAMFIKDLDASDLPQIATAIYDHLVHTHTLSDDEAESVRKMLLLKHAHVGHKRAGERPSSPSGLNLQDMGERNFTTPSMLHHAANTEHETTTKLPKVPETEPAPPTIGKPKKSILDMFKPHIGGVADLLTTDCEVVSSLVGFSPFVSTTLTVVLRLAHGVWLPTFSEVDRPTRFIFLFLVPIHETGAKDPRDEYNPREIGRAFATLMADQDFHEIAYRAECREDLVSGLRDFLDNSIVLPPGEWDRATLLPVVKYQRERIAAKRAASKRTMSMRSRHDVEPSLQSGQLAASVGARLTDMEGALSAGMPDNDLNAAMANAAVNGDGYLPEYTVTGTKVSSGHRCRRCCARCVPFSGLCNDLGRLRRRIVSDFTDPFKKGGIVDVLVGSLFLIFVALAPAITFGALMEQFVNPQLSLSKSLVAAGAFQLIFTLLGGQPQIVLGVTGPVFIIETTVAMMAQLMQLEFVAFRFIVSVSASAWGLIFLAFNFATYLSRVPRSVEEIFNMFTAIFYVFKAIISVAKPLFKGDYLDIIATTNMTHLGPNATHVRTQAFRHFASANGTILIAIGTYMLVMMLAKFKQSRAFTRRVRWFLGSFNVPMAILIMTVVSNLLFADYPVPNLKIPASAADPASWFTIPRLSELRNAGVGSILLAVLVGLCVHLLTFTETGICGLTLSKAETGMKKPTLFHLNILIVQTIFPMISGIMCWPFFTGAVVRSNAHVLALQVWEDRALPGVRRRLVGVREQRISGVIIGCFVFLCVFLGPYVLRLIPMGAMYGMFLFMGVSTFRGLQLVTRTSALLRRRRYWPDASYLQAPLRVLITFSAIEWFVVALLFTLNCLTEFADMSYPSLLFPLILVAFGLLRILILPRVDLLKDHLKTIDKGHGIMVDPPGAHKRCCGGGDSDDDSEMGLGTASGKSSRRMTPVASATGFDGMDGVGITSTVYERDSDDSDTDADLYENTDRPF